MRGHSSILTVAIPLYISTRNVWRFQFLYILGNIYSSLFYYSHSRGLICYFVVWSCFSLLINDAEHHFICLLSISIYSLVKCLFILCLFFNGVWPGKLGITFFLVSLWNTYNEKEKQNIFKSKEKTPPEYTKNSYTSEILKSCSKVFQI